MEHYCLKLETRRVLESLQTVRNKQERSRTWDRKANRLSSMTEMEERISV